MCHICMFLLQACLYNLPIDVNTLCMVLNMHGTWYMYALCQYFSFKNELNFLG